MAVLKKPVVLLKSALAPQPVFASPTLFSRRALTPTAVLFLEVKEGVCPFSGIEVGIASVHCRHNSLGRRRKPKAAERHGNENWQNCCVFGLSQRIHGFFLSFLMTDFRFLV